MEAIYVNVLYSILQPLGKCADGFTCDKQKMLDSVQLAFDMTKEEHSKLMSAAKKRARPRVVLRVKVFEAKSLKAKDVIGTSDPYCVLGIQTEKYQNSKKKTAREILPKHKYSTTRILHKELNPSWKEYFQFGIKNPKKDCFLLDIWDNDPEQSFTEAVLNLGHSEGAEGLHRCMKDVKKALKGDDPHDFLGRMSYPVNSIPSTGDRAWYPLEGRSPKSDVQGLVEIGFRLSVIKPKVHFETGKIREFPVDDSCRERITQNVEVISVFIKHTLNNIDHLESEKWDGSMPIDLITVIHLHALHNDLDKLQEDISFWIAYTEQHHIRNMCYSAMLFCLTKLKSAWDEADRKTLHYEETFILQKAFHIFIGDCLENLSCYRDHSKDGTDFGYLLKCLEILENFDLERMCNPDRKLTDQIGIALMQGTDEWYKTTSEVVGPYTKQPKEVIQNLLNLTLNINGDFVKAHCYYKSQFGVLGVDYEILIYPLIEKLLVTDITNAFNILGSGDRVVISEIIKFRKNWEREEELWTTYFKLYIALKEISKFLEKLPLDLRHSPNLTEYHEWFRYHLEHWMVMSHEKSLAVIKKAIMFDEATSVTNGTSFTSSAVDVGVCLNELSEMVSQLAWPNQCECYAIGNLVLAMISDGAKLYAKLIRDKLKAANFFDNIGQFDVSEQLYLIINSIEQVRLSLAPQFHKLESLKPSESTLNDDDIERISFLSEARHVMYEDANSTILEVIQHVLAAVAGEMKLDVIEKVKAISSEKQEDREDAFRRLNIYLEENLGILHANLMVTNFDRFLFTLWDILLKVIGEITLKNVGKKEQTYFDWMCEVLDRVEAIFHANGDGLPTAKMETNDFIEIKKEILLRGRPFYECEKPMGQRKLHLLLQEPTLVDISLS